MNLEKLSTFYIEQTFKSDIFAIRTPYYFMQEEKRRAFMQQKHMNKKKMSTDQVLLEGLVFNKRNTPNRDMEEQKHAMEQQPMLRRISEENHTLSIVDHNKIVIQKLP